MRKEKDSIGTIEIENDAVYGIHSLRGFLNFPQSGERINPYLIKAFLWVKKATTTTNLRLNSISQEKGDAILSAIDELLLEIENTITKNDNTIYEKIIVDPFQGGAGTSLNMNINEVIANIALKKIEKNYGDYNYIHPIDDVNLNQSTNDTYPTALKVAAIILLRELQDSFALLQNNFQAKEKEFIKVAKLARTQCQDAVPITLGEEFGAYAQAVARDRWRLFNCEERLRSVNLGGTAVGNSILAEKNYTLSVCNELKIISGLPIAKAEDLIDATQNLDVVVEVHGLVKTGATSIMKICNDLRFLSSGPNGGIGEINLPQLQAGSSIMPGKVNPIILEHSIQVAELVKGNDVMISNLVSNGHLELNPFTPMIAHCLLKSIQMLRDAVVNLAEKCIQGITANEERCFENLSKSTALAALFIEDFGYDKISSIVKQSIIQKKDFLPFLQKELNLSNENLEEIIKNKTGYNLERST
ncbi:MAG: aspartate ammonia-lyase [Chlorobiaceae bacterium]|nr:aspartate ammonia-lyase [Chlorobiaceae bacterium]MBA4308900.1 aspartate ammonia-lyase [Chlorobiaceae bacterium]